MPAFPRRRRPGLAPSCRRGRRLGAESLEPRRVLATFAYSGSALSVGLDAAATLSVSSGGSGEYVLSLAGGDKFTGADTTGLTGNGLSTLTVTGALTLTSIAIANTVDATAVEFIASAGSYVDDVAVKLSRISTGTVPEARIKGSTTFADAASLSVTAPVVSVTGTTVSTVTGPLTLSGDTGSAVLSPVTGLTISGSTVTTAGGPLTLAGRGGNGDGGTLRGVAILSNSQVRSGDTGTAFPTLSITGVGGKSSGAGTGSDGVYVDATSAIQTTGAAVTINGTGGGANNGNRGIDLEGSVGVGATASNPNPALLLLNGTGGGSGTSAKDNVGVYLASTSRLTAHTGAININGTGGVGTTSATAPYLSSPGILLDSPTVVAIDGPVTLVADGYGFGSGTKGLFVTNSTLSVLNANAGQVMRLDSTASAQITNVAAREIVIGDSAKLPVIEQSSAASGGALTFGSPNLTVNGAPIRLRANVTNTGTQTWNGPVVLGADADAADVTLTSKGTTFKGTVDGAKNLVLRPGGGSLRMEDVVGGTTPLASLTIGPAIGVTALKTLAIDGSAAGANADGLTLEAGAAGVNMQAAGSSITKATGSGIRLNGSPGSTIGGFTLSKNGTGVMASGISTGTTLRANNLVANGTGILIDSATNLSIDGNTLTGNTAQAIRASGNDSGTTITGNTIRNSPFGIVMDGTLGLGVGAAGRGNVIAAGADAAGTRLPGSNAYGIYAAGILSGSTVVANAVVDNAVGMYLAGAKGLVVNGRNLLYRNASHGIVVVGDSLSTTIQQNVIDGTMPDGTKAAYGVYLLSATRMLFGGAGLGNAVYSANVGVCATGNLSGSVVHGNQLLNNVSGVVVVSGTGLIVSRNDIHGSASAAFRASGICTSTTVSGNDIHHSGNGVILDAAQYMAVHSNRIYSNRGYGLLARGVSSGTAAYGNSITGNGVNVDTSGAVGGSFQRR